MKAKTIRAIEPNAGSKAKFEKKLAAFFEASETEATKAIVEGLINEGILVETSEDMAQDASFFGFELDMGKLLGRTMKLRPGVSPEVVDKNVSTTIRSFLSRILIKQGENAKEVSRWFVRSAARSVTSSQRKALTDAGISPTAIRKKWNIPVINGLYMSPKAAEQLPGIVDDMTGLITRMAAEDLERVRGVITQGVTSGGTLSDIERALRASKGFSLARAKRVALDQSIKVHQAVQRANAEELGITEGIWVHVPGRYTSRKTHMAMNGKRFKLSEGLYDSDVGKKVVPGECPFCRCVYRSVLPPELLE